MVKKWHFRKWFLDIEWASTWSWRIILIKKIDFYWPGCEEAPLQVPYSRFFPFFDFFTSFFQSRNCACIELSLNPTMPWMWPVRDTFWGRKLVVTDFFTLPLFLPPYFGLLFFLNNFELFLAITSNASICHCTTPHQFEALGLLIMPIYGFTCVPLRPRTLLASKVYLSGHKWRLFGQNDRNILIFKKS